MKLRYFFVTISILLLLVVSFLTLRIFRKNEKERTIQKKMDFIITQIDSFRIEDNGLPHSICDLDLTTFFENEPHASDSIPIHYLKYSESDYYLWADSSLCYPKVFNSSSRKWQTGLPKSNIKYTEQDLLGSWKGIGFSCAMCNDCHLRCLYKNSLGEDVTSSGELIRKTQWKIENNEFYITRFLSEGGIPIYKNGPFFIRIVNTNNQKYLVLTSLRKGTVYSYFLDSRFKMELN